MATESFSASTVVCSRAAAKSIKDALKLAGWLDKTRRVLVSPESDEVSFPISCPSSGSNLLPAALREATKAGLARLESRELELNTAYLEKKPAEAIRATVRRLLREANHQDVDEGILEDLPQRWERLGDVALIPATSLKDPRWSSVGAARVYEAVASSIGTTRLVRQATVDSGHLRESRAVILWPEGASGWTQFKENGVVYSLDVTKVMFSSGNGTEKARMGRVASKGEVVVDLYAGIGYYTLQMLVHAGVARVHACEWNPNSVEALRRNLEYNKVADRCQVLEGDNREMAPRGVADRVLLGLLPSSEPGWRTAALALKEGGGWLHVHGNVRARGIREWAAGVAATFEGLFKEDGRCFQVKVSHVEEVKSYAPHILHVVADLLCRPAAAAHAPALAPAVGAMSAHCLHPPSSAEVAAPDLSRPTGGEGAADAMAGVGDSATGDDLPDRWRMMLEEPAGGHDGGAAQNGSLRDESSCGTPLRQPCPSGTGVGSAGGPRVPASVNGTTGGSGDGGGGHSGRSKGCVRLHRPSRRELEAGPIALSVPAVLTGFDLGPAATQWTPEYLSSLPEAASAKVSVHISSTPELDFVQKNFRFVTMPLADMVRLAAGVDSRTISGHDASRSGGESGGGPRHYYLRSVGENPRREPANFATSFPALAADLSVPDLFPPEDFFASVLRVSSPGLSLWTHYDAMDNILIQLSGSKRVLLFLPEDIGCLYMEGSSSRVISVDSHDPSRFPRFGPARGRALEVTLHPGDILFIPALWPHHIRANDFSVSVNVFWRHFPADTTSRKDLYGNRDPFAAEAAFAAGELAVQALLKLPEETGARHFYARMLIAQIEARVFTGGDAGFAFGDGA